MELTRIFLDRIQEVNPRINAVVQLASDQALATAQVADEKLAGGSPLGPLHGLPITIKDSFDTAGIISTAGTLGRSKYVPERDAAVVQRLKQAGAIILGKTNTPELTLAGETDNLVYGETLNPYNLDHSPGGSSGGAGAIVSAGGSAFDVGTDTGGSIRNPAHACGICGIKPTSGRVPRTGHIISFHGFDQALTSVGPLTRKVEDLITILPVMVGGDGVDPYIYDFPVGNAYTVDVPSLRFAFYTDTGTVRAGEKVSQMMDEVARRLAAEGAPMEEARAGVIEQTFDLFFEVLFADQGYSANRLLQMAGTREISPLLDFAREPEQGFEVPSISPKQFASVFEKWASFRSEMTLFYRDVDIVLCPASTMAAHPRGFEDVARNTLSYTATYNLTGWPVAVVRAGTSSDGLPLGIQVVGKPWQEDKVLAVAKWIEDAFGGYQPPTL